MANNSTPQTPPPAPAKPNVPPEAYAAFVRIYIEWMEKNGDEQINVLEHGVQSARTSKNAYLHGMLSDKSGNSREILGQQFEEYVNTTWIKFTEKCDNPDEFALYLQRDFDRYMKKYAQILQEYENIRLEFLEGVFDKWYSVTGQMTNAQFQGFFSAELQRQIAKFNINRNQFENQKAKLEFLEQIIDKWCSAIEKMTIAQQEVFFNTGLQKQIKEFKKKERKYERIKSGYPTLQMLLRRSAQNYISKIIRQKKEENEARHPKSLEGMAEKGIIPEVIYGAGINLEERKVLQDTIKSFEATLDDKSKKIIELFRDDPEIKQVEIAKELGISEAAVSKHLKKIRAKLEVELKD